MKVVPNVKRMSDGQKISSQKISIDSSQQFRPYIARKWIRGISEFQHKAFLLSKKFLKIPPYAERLRENERR